MYQYKVSNDVSSSANNILDKKNKSAEDFINDLREINFTLSNSSKVEIPTAPKFERMSDVEIDDKKIEEDSISSLEGYRNQSIENIEQEFVDKEKELNDNKQSLIDTHSNDRKNIKQAYDSVRENASNDALKRGLARSSIVINTLDAFNDSELEAYNTLDKELSNNINAINFELNALVSNKEDALNNFDIEYASKLNEKINETTERLRKAQEEVIKYNNEIAEKEAEYSNKISKLEAELSESKYQKDKDYAKLVAEYGITVVDRVRNTRLLNRAKSYFAGLSKKEAAEIVTNYPEIVALLGEANYNELRKMYE